MSVYFVKKKGWRYDFTLKGTRYTESWFETKRAARQAEEKRREETRKPQPNPVVTIQTQEIPTDMGFLELVNRRLDFLKDYKSAKYYSDTFYQGKRWIKVWGSLACDDITEDMVHRFLRERKKVSSETGNAEIRALKALFNFGKRKKWIDANPMDDIEFFPVEKKEKYVPSQEDIDKVISVADSEMSDYLWVIRETFARVSEVNRLTWDDVNFENQYVVLYTRKKKGGHLTPRRVPMTIKLNEVLLKRFEERHQDKP